MKKHYLKLVTFFLLPCLLITSCQKIITESPEETASKFSDASVKTQCQLTSAIDWGGYLNLFHYNDKGLADEWRIDLGSGTPEVLTMQYDNNNHLSIAQWHSSGTLIATMVFDWTGDRLVTEHWDFGGYLFDVTNTYNAKGQIIKRSSSDGFLTTYEFTPEGNHFRDIIYFEGEPLQADEYTYSQPNKNPFLAIPGIPYLFLFTNPFTSKWFPVSDKFFIYDNGNPVVVLDIDPSKTVMQMTHQNYLSSATYFDNLSGNYLTKNFEYQNCGPANQAPATTANSFSPTDLSASRKSAKRSPLLLGTPDDIRNQIAKLRKQYLNK